MLKKTSGVLQFNKKNQIKLEITCLPTHFLGEFRHFDASLNRPVLTGEIQRDVSVTSPPPPTLDKCHPAAEPGPGTRHFIATILLFVT